MSIIYIGRLAAVFGFLFFFFFFGGLMSLMPFMWIFETSFKDLYYCNQVHRFKGLIFSCLCLV